MGCGVGALQTLEFYIFKLDKFPYSAETPSLHVLI